MDLGNNYDPGVLSDVNAGVRIQRPIIRDAKPLPLDEESETASEQELSPSPISVQVWDEHQRNATVLTKTSDELASDENCV